MESDYLKAREKFSVASFIVIDGGYVCCTQCTFVNGAMRIDNNADDQRTRAGARFFCLPAHGLNLSRLLNYAD